MGDFMKTIRFNDNYPKLHGQTEAKLVFILSIPEKSLRTVFNDLWLYDTLCSDGKYRQAFSVGQRFLLLLFLGDKNILFTTLRTDNEENRAKYFNFVGQDFKLEVASASKNEKQSNN